MDIMELLATRRTYRRFQQTPVPAAVVDDMIQAVRLSSCGGNRQAIRLVVVQSPEMVARVQPLVKWAAYLPPEQGTPGPGEQPVLFVAVVQDASIPGDKDTDAGIALANLTLAAWARGVGSCIMGAIDRPRLTGLLGLAENETLHTMVALGYPAHAARVVPLTEATGVKYYLDANRDYCVPKRSAEEIARYERSRGMSELLHGGAAAPLLSAPSGGVQNMDRYVFVILHYNTLDDTMECVESIERVCGQASYHIIVVDNCSPNGSGTELKRRFADKSRVTVLLNSKNLGFARGNNVGFAYAKKVLHPDFIILLNNDTVLFQEDFLHLISKTYQMYGYAVLGPMILTADGRCDSSPLSYGPLDRASVQQQIQAVKLRLFCAKYHLLWTSVLYKRILKRKSVRPRPYLEQQNVKLHGSFMIFSRLYIDQFDGLDSRTFMYAEEDFLQKRLQDYHMMSLYCPQLVIYHKEGSSTQHTYRNNRKKYIFFWENSLKSLQLLLSDF